MNDSKSRREYILIKELKRILSSSLGFALLASDSMEAEQE